MQIKYKFVRFRGKIIGNPRGDTRKVEVWMSMLNGVCEKLGGHQLDLRPYPHEITLELVQETSKYLVGNCWVSHDVNLLAETITTDVGYLEGHEDKALIEKLKELYGGEGSMYPSTATHEREE